MPSSRAWMARAAMASTVISPRVSKPRKSTRITLTTLAPPPPERLLAVKNPEMVACVRVSMAQASRPVLPPNVRASSRSRPRRTGVDSTWPCCGRKNRASSSRMMVTISMASWVRARSGAEKRTKARADIRPTTLRGSRASSRCRRQRTVSTAPAMMIRPPIRARPSSGVGGIVPVRGLSPVASGAAMARAATARRRKAYRCREPFSMARLRRPVPAKTASMNPENRRQPSTSGKSRSWRANSRWRWPYRAIPPIRAIRLITTGRLKPCQIAR